MQTKFVSENSIDAVIDTLDALSDDQYERLMQQFAAEQPVLVAYLFSEENFQLLTEDERGYLQYLALIVWMANTNVNGPAEPVTKDRIGQAEEKNYELLDSGAAKPFRKRLDVFFENTTQEDLLALAEEAVLEDEDESEGLVTKEGRETVFVAVKTVIDVLCG